MYMTRGLKSHFMETSIHWIWIWICIWIWIWIWIWIHCPPPPPSKWAFYHQEHGRHRHSPLVGTESRVGKRCINLGIAGALNKMDRHERIWIMDIKCSDNIQVDTPLANSALRPHKWLVTVAPLIQEGHFEPQKSTFQL